MGAARGRYDPAMAEEPADDRQAFAERERPRGKGGAKVMDSEVIEPGAGTDCAARGAGGRSSERLFSCRL